MSGWVKLWRKSIDSGLPQNLELWGFWCWCLLKASHRVHKQMVGNQILELQPGQFIFGRRKAARELNVSEKKIRTFLKKLENLQNVAIKRANKFSIISIINWDFYQQLENGHGPSEGPTEGQQRASKGPQTRREEGEKGKKKEYTVSFEKFWKAYPNKKCGKATAFRAWAKQNGNRPAVDDLLAVLDQQKQSEQWQKNGGDFIPMASTWLNQERWDAEMNIENRTANGDPF